ncbi:MAG: DUF192 domain-containing protein [Actinomycetota bacterium]|nr:DUF192 domain-containing protein [Actinomycetota bacterium]
MTGNKLLAIVVLLLAGSCGRSSDAGGNAGPSPTTATVYIKTGEETVLVDVEVADSPEERARGLMYRESLPEDAGMLFVFFERSTSGFWMKNTKIPLSIAFFDQQGKIMSILDMEPCTRDRCRFYTPPTPYWGALEVNQGAFEEWGVEVGDLVRTNQ